MNVSRSLIAFALTSALGIATGGCKDDSAPAPAATATPEPSGSTASADPAKTVGKRLGPAGKMDPHVMKAYRADVCYFGTLSLKQARDAYVASLGGAEPSADKVPNFGQPKPEEAEKPAADAPQGDDKAKDPRGLITKKALEARRKASMRAPHERNARSCSVAAGLRTPPVEGLDAVLAEFAPFAVQLAKDLTAASVYYQREQHKEDQFAKGKEYHTKLLAHFEKLDKLHGKLGEEIAKWREAAPPPVDKEPEAPAEQTDKDKEMAVQNAEARRLGNAAFRESREVMLMLASAEPDTAAVKEKLAKVTEATEALKKFGSENKENTWPKIMVASLEAFIKAFKDRSEADELKDPSARIELINMTTRLIEARHRALTRAFMTRGRGFQNTRLRPRVLPPGHPGMNPKAQPQKKQE